MSEQLELALGGMYIVTIVVPSKLRVFAKSTADAVHSVEELLASQGVADVKVLSAVRVGTEIEHTVPSFDRPPPGKPSPPAGTPGSPRVFSPTFTRAIAGAGI